jgi:hypothetical protein
MAGVSPGVMAPDCENGVWLAVMTPEKCAARVTASRVVVWTSQNELSKSPPLISSSEVGRGEPRYFVVAVRWDYERIGKRHPLGNITSVFNGEPAGMTLLSYAKRG